MTTETPTKDAPPPHLQSIAPQPKEAPAEAKAQAAPPADTAAKKREIIADVVATLAVVGLVWLVVSALKKGGGAEKPVKEGGNTNPFTINNFLPTDAGDSVEFFDVKKEDDAPAPAPKAKAKPKEAEDE